MLLLLPPLPPLPPQWQKLLLSLKRRLSFDAVLTDVGANKINVIKVVRELTGLGLKEAKAVVDEAPKPIKEAVSKEEAEKIAAKMAEVGAKVTIK